MYLSGDQTLIVLYCEYKNKITSNNLLMYNVDTKNYCKTIGFSFQHT